MLKYTLPLIGPLVGFILKVAMSITMRVPVWKLHFLLDWRLLIQAHFPNIVILLVFFATLLLYFLIFLIFKFFGALCKPAYCAKWGSLWGRIHGCGYWR